MMHVSDRGLDPAYLLPPPTLGKRGHCSLARRCNSRALACDLRENASLSPVFLASSSTEGCQSTLALKQAKIDSL